MPSMVKDTHQLRRSIVSFLKDVTSVTYQELTDTFQKCGATPSAVRTASVDLKTLGFLEKDGDDITLSANHESAPVTSSAQLYNALCEKYSVGAVLSTNLVKQSSPFDDEI